MQPLGLKVTKVNSNPPFYKKPWLGSVTNHYDVIEPPPAPSQTSREGGKLSNLEIRFTLEVTTDRTKGKEALGYPTVLYMNIW